MKKKTIYIIAGSVVLLGIAAWVYYYYFSDDTTTDANGVTYYPDGSYSYEENGQTVTVSAEGYTTYTGPSITQPVAIADLGFDLPGTGVKK